MKNAPMDDWITAMNGSIVVVPVSVAKDRRVDAHNHSIIVLFDDTKGQTPADVADVVAEFMAKLPELEAEQHAHFERQSQR